ncbi:MAG: hypothetical protein LDLANPLL_02281 [Turneriella sp.]|nr:hypothetical protein [Turneriella sp.]
MQKVVCQVKPKWLIIYCVFFFVTVNLKSSPAHEMPRNAYSKSLDEIAQLEQKLHRYQRESWRVEMEWQSDENAVGYEIRITETNTQKMRTTTSDKPSLSELFSKGNYKIEIRGINRKQKAGPWSLAQIVEVPSVSLLQEEKALGAKIESRKALYRSLQQKRVMQLQGKEP